MILTREQLLRKLMEAERAYVEACAALQTTGRNKEAVKHRDRAGLAMRTYRAQLAIIEGAANPTPYELETRKKETP